MERIKCVVRYDGTNFSGYQIQNNDRTVQGVIQEALFKLHKHEVTIFASGRTDAKVHAKGQVFHFDTDLDMSIIQWKKAINSHLPSDVYILNAEKVDSSFHARYSAIEKQYEYIINTFEYDPLEINYIYQLEENISIDKIKEACKLFIGEHDFRNFCANEEEKTESYVRIIKSIDVRTINGRLHFYLTGNGFMRYMVRMIVGTIVEYAKRKMSLEYIKEKLEAKSHDPVPYRVPGCGLYLVSVTYKSEIENKVNYHTHTYRCMHANGSDEEYVESAIANGYKILGFSDHMMVPGVDNDAWTRGKWSDFPGYKASIESLKEKYKDQIKICIGMECEYFPELYDFLKDLLVSKKVDYLIFGNHYKHYDGKRIYGYMGSSSTDEDVIEYTTLAIQGLKSGLFSIFAHPDLFMYSMKEWTPVCEDCAMQICELAKKMDIPLEINQGGIRYSISGGVDISKRFRYPYYKFWEIAKKVGNRVVIGVDAHNPKDFNDPAVKLSYEFAKKLGIEIESEIKFKDIK